MEKILKDLGAFEAEARTFALQLKPQAESATLVTLSGELGAGKTAFVKAAAKAFGVDETVTSPTFVLEKIYAIPNGALKNLIHIDAYRFEESKEIEVLNFNDIMKDPGNLIMLEWPERVTANLPKAHSTVTFEALPDGSRKIMYV